MSVRHCSAVIVGLLVCWSAVAQAASVVVTVYPLVMLTRAIGGERVDVHVLLPPGASPHAFEPRPSDLARVARAELFLSVGGGLDDWAQRLAQTSGDGSGPISVFELLGRENSGRSAHEHDAHDHHAEDPHIWLDPITVRDEIAPALTSVLLAIDPDAEAYYRARLGRFRAELTALDGELRNLLTGKARQYVAFHNAWRHFAARYELEELAVVQEAAGEQPTPRELADMVRDAREARLGAILIEPQLDPRIARTLSHEFGGVTVLVDPLGNPDDPARSTYPGLMRFNARAFRSAMDLLPHAHRKTRTDG